MKLLPTIKTCPVPTRDRVAAEVGTQDSDRSLVSLSLDPATVDDDFIRVKYHKDQAYAEDYTNEGVGAMLKKWQAEMTAGILGTVNSGLEAFACDKGAGEQK